MHLSVLFLASLALGRVVHRHHANEKRDPQNANVQVQTVIVNASPDQAAAATTAAASSAVATYAAAPSAAAPAAPSGQPAAGCTTGNCANSGSASGSTAGSTGPASASGSYPSSGSTASSSGAGGSSFQDGTIDCSQFPSGVDGVVSTDWLNLGGWSGIQSGNGAGNACTEGSYCSYACQPGMAKTQWPSNQPSDGQTRGGLLCQGGKLYRTRTDVQPLCAVQAQSASVVNELGQSVVLCQTDYPGNEAMTIPTITGGSDNSSSPLTCIDESTYFKWGGKPTSAQFYVQPAGVSVEKGCVWGTPGSNIGNFSPLNFGAGKATDGNTYLSIIPNPQGSLSALNFNVEIVADAGGSINGACAVKNGQYTGGSGSNGCTVTVTSGTASFRIF